MFPWSITYASWEFDMYIVSKLMVNLVDEKQNENET